jgi:hypothetical protein
MLGHYPIIEFPLAIKLAQEAIPPSPVEPPIPPVPVYPVPTRGFTAPSIVLIISMLLLGTWLLSQHLELLAALVVASGGLVWWRTRRSATARYEQAVTAYPTEMSQYQAYPARRAQYEHALAAYSHPETLRSYRAQQMANVLAAFSIPFFPISGLEPLPKRGRSEATICINHRVPVDDERLKTSWYYPDFIYHDSSGLCIDIEIDEPYTLDSRKPIHCKGQDDYRNAFFLRKQWVVVRFMEQQVMQHPLLCCKELAALIFHLNGRHYAARFYHERLPRQPQWDQAEARRRARSRTRELSA